MIAFDTLAAMKALRSAGMPDAQAESVVAVINDASSQSIADLASKQDLKDVETRLAHKIDIEIGNVRTEIITSQNKVILWVVGAIFTVPGVYIAIGKTLHLF